MERGNEKADPQRMHPVQVKARQKRSRDAAQLRGTSGRAEHKGKARSTNKPDGGRMAM